MKAMTTAFGLVSALSLGFVSACSSDSNSDQPSNKAAVGGAQEVKGKKPKKPATPNLAELAASVPQLSTLLSLVQLCDLGGALVDPAASLTVFAPTNDAFTKFLNGAPFPAECSAEIKATLVYHIIPAKVLSTDLGEKQAAPTLLGGNNEVFVTKSEGKVTVNGGSTVTLADALASNGVAHLVDTVLVPDALGTVVDAAVKRYELTSLVGAVAAAGLVETLATAQNITVFAPLNSAFAELSAVPSGEALTKVLTHHVLGSKVLAANLALGLQTVPTLNTDSLSIFVDESGAKIWGSAQTEATGGKILQTDIITKNGVIHAISKVLIPNNL